MSMIVNIAYTVAEHMIIIQSVHSSKLLPKPVAKVCMEAKSCIVRIWAVCFLNN